MTEDLRVRVDAEPEPGLLRPAIEAALAGRPWPAGPETLVADAVAMAVRASAVGPHSGEESATSRPPGPRTPCHHGAHGGEDR